MRHAAVYILFSLCPTGASSAKAGEAFSALHTAPVHSAEEHAALGISEGGGGLFYGYLFRAVTDCQQVGLPNLQLRCTQHHRGEAARNLIAEQNIPVRTEMGREIRKAFITKPGCVLADADYSQIELRVMAHFSGDPAMVDAFKKGQDVHTRTAAEVYGVPMEAVTREMRSSAKAVNFGLVYGISEFGLARNIGVSRKRAGEFIARYFDRYPGVKKFMDEAVKEGYEKGYAVTMLGRRRQLPELKASNANTRNFGERAAMNTPVQGTAADIIKLAMVRVHEALKQEGLQARLILQVHDELLIEAPKEEEETVTRILRQCMEQVFQLSVPLVAEVKTGNSWFETK